MAKKTRATGRTRSRQREGPGEMPAGEMTEPVTEGLTEMPSGEDPGMAGQPASRSSSARTGLMPGEEATQAGSRDGEMPGGAMSRTE